MASVKGKISKRKKVLVVDNHPVMLKYMRRLLEKRGDDVLTAEDGLTALKVLKTHTPDVIFVDQIMPNISGDKLCKIIRSRPAFEDVCIIVLSAIAAEEDFNFSRFDANYCIAKGPFDKMSTHILALLYQLDAEGKCGSSDIIIGREDVFYRQISKELIYSKRHAEIILSHLAEGIIELTPDREIVYANPTALSIIGIQEVELLGSDFVELFYEKDKQQIEEMFGMIASGSQMASGQSCIFLSDRPISINMLRITNEAHNAISVILTDMSSTRLLQHQLLQSERLAATGQLAASIAHEINSPLQAVFSTLSNLRLIIKDDSEVKEHIDLLQRALNNISDTVNNLLDLNRPGEKGKQAANINLIIQKTIGLLQSHLKSFNIKLHLDLAPDLLDTIVSPQQISQMFINLINNAVEAITGISEFGGKRKTPWAQAEEIFIKTRMEGGSIVVTISDSGPGISEKDLDHVFDPFFTRKKKMGMGVGLSICHGIVEDHNGTIFVKNSPGGGAIFSITLPI